MTLINARLHLGSIAYCLDEAARALGADTGIRGIQLRTAAAQLRSSADAIGINRFEFAGELMDDAIGSLWDFDSVFIRTKMIPKLHETVAMLKSIDSVKAPEGYNRLLTVGQYLKASYFDLVDGLGLLVAALNGEE